MYCKNCGKKLPDGARFCDRCNISVRKKSGKMDIIEGLKEERIARRKAKAVEERLKKIKKVKNKRRKTVIGVIAAFVFLGIISAVTANIIFSSHSTFNRPIDDVPSTTEEQSEEPSSTAVVIGGEEETADSKSAVNSDGYIVRTIGYKDFAYPGDFAEDASGLDGMVTLKDSVGDAEIVVSDRVADVAETADIMKSCISEAGISVTKASAGDSSYSITGTRGEDIYHRFGYISDGIEIYYELTYPSDSKKKSVYESNAEYMDSFLKDESQGKQ